MNRLFRQDRLIASNTIRATFAGWHDHAIAAFMVLAALAVAHAWFADRPWRVAAWTALGVGTLIGTGAGRLVGGVLLSMRSTGCSQPTPCIRRHADAT